MSIEIPKGIDVHRLDPGAPLTRLDKRAIRTAWMPAVAPAVLVLPGFTNPIVWASTAALVVVALTWLFALGLLVAQAGACRRLAAHQIVRADLNAVSGTCPYPEYCQWVASLPEPGPVWRALGAPTPQQRLRILHEFRAR